MEWITVESRLILACVFAASAISKTRSAAAFAGYRRAVAALGRMPARLVTPAGLAVVAAEALLTAGLLVPRTATPALGAAAGLLFAFTAVLARAIRAGESVACHCFGSSNRPVGARQLARNAALIALALAGSAAGLCAAGDHGRAGLGAFAVALLGALLPAASFVLWDDLADLLVPQRVSR